MQLRHVLPVLSLSLAAAFNAHAGGFGGPGPFRNGSPLPTGTDGIYSAVANGTNLTGLFSFAIRGGIQTEGSRGNSWVFFVDGQTVRGTTSATVGNGKVVGVLDSGLSTGASNTDGEVTLPIIIYVPGNAGNGFFQGKMDMNSPTGYFDGKGTLSGSPSRVDQIVIVDEGGTTVTPVIIPGSSLGDIAFKFRGSRVATSTAGLTSGNGTSTSN